MEPIYGIAMYVHRRLWIGGFNVAGCCDKGPGRPKFGRLDLARSLFNQKSEGTAVMNISRPIKSYE